MADEDDRGRNHFPPLARDAHLWMSNEEDERAVKRLIENSDALCKLAGLSVDVRDFLLSLREEEVETIRTLSRLDEEERDLVFYSIKLAKSVRTTGWFVRWLFLGLLGIFITFNLMSDQVMKFVHLLQSGASK